MSTYLHNITPRMRANAMVTGGRKSYRRGLGLSNIPKGLRKNIYTFIVMLFEITDPLLNKFDQIIAPALPATIMLY